MKRWLFVAMALWLTGCETTGQPPIPEADSPEAQLFLAKCTQCHSWPHPARHSATEWDHYLKLMDQEMAKRGKSLTANERETIRAYLHKNAH